MTFMPSLILLFALAAVGAIAGGNPKRNRDRFYRDNQNNIVSNPDWTDYKTHTDKFRETMAFPSTPADIASLEQLEPNSKAAKSVGSSLEMYGKVATDLFGDYSGLSQELMAKFQQYRIPIGVLQKLLVFKDLNRICFLIDDSESMSYPVKTRSPELRAACKELHQGGVITRWTEAYLQIKKMLDILQYVCKPKIVIRFLCRTPTAPVPSSIARFLSFFGLSSSSSSKDIDGSVLYNDEGIVINSVKGESPSAFFNSAMKVIRRQFRTPPTGSQTPICERMEALLKRYEEENVAFYIFCDGEPNSPDSTTKQLEKKIEAMVTERLCPVDHPITFVSCSDNDDQIAWMKRVEAVAPFTSELDDIESEAKEVVSNQGEFFPYTPGLYLISLLVASMNPDDLDALDEAVPMTKHTLESLFGISYSESTYRYYFEGVIEAQEYNNQIDMEMIARSYALFLQDDTVARQLPVVQEFRLKLANQLLSLDPRPVYLRHVKPMQLRRATFVRGRSEFTDEYNRYHPAVGRNPYPFTIGPGAELTGKVQGGDMKSGFHAGPASSSSKQLPQDDFKIWK